MTYDARGTITLDPNTYGKLYTGNAAMRNYQVSANGGLQGICPNGWHIPTTAEVDAMMSLYTPRQVMSTQGWIPAEGTNESGFNMLPAGFYNASMNNFERAYVTGIFWTTTPGTTIYHKCQFGSACSSWEIIPGDTVYAYSVRCVRDTTDTITFVANGGAESMVQQLVTRSIPTALNTNAFTHGGNWEFRGWNDACDGNGTTYADGANITTNGNVTLYAQWHTWCTGTAKSNELGTSRIDSVKDHQDNWYKVVEIGTGANKQCWLKENMRATTEPTAPGTSILRDKAAGISYTERRAYYYDDLLANGEKYGCLYNFLAAMDIPNLSTSFTQPRQGICPDGWHIPSDVEWMNMEKMVAPTATDINTTSTTWQGTSTNLAVSLSGGCDWEGDDGTGRTPRSYSNAKRDSSGFSVLPTGYFSGNVYYRINQWTYFWTATLDSDNTNRTFRRALYYDRKGMLRNSNTIDNGFSVRCVRDIMDTITFMPNGATGGTMSQQVVTHGTAATLSANLFTHDGNWEFKGWNTDALGNGTSYAAGANITTNGNVTLHAQWHTWCTGTAKSNESGTSRIDSVYDHQGNWYKVVEIGTGANKQCWLKENMRATTEPGSSTSIVQTPASGTSFSAHMAYRYDNSTTYSDKYGLLYNFPAAMNINDQRESFNYPHRGICPKGWHIPEDSEWSTLATAAGCSAAFGSGTGLGKLTGGCDWTTDGSGSQPGNYSYSERNSSGFSALPAGYHIGSFGNAGISAAFWSSTPNGSGVAYTRGFYYGYEYVARYCNYRDYGFSVRCVRDRTIIVTTDSVRNVSDSAATCYATVVDDGGKAVTARGVCWSKSAYPTINDSHTSDGTGTGNFVGTITGLEEITNYYVRAYATNSDGTVYGNQIKFTTAGCLAAGTRITMADGSYKNVENIAVGDLVRTFNHETGEISSAEICMAWKSENTKRALNLTFASGKSVGIVGTHDFLIENTRKYVRINQDNVAEYVGKRFYNAESGSWDALVSYEMGVAVNYYCPYTAKHLNCLAEGMLTCPDDVDYILNIYELDANLKADSAQLAADIAQYGLCNVANDFPEFVQYKAQMDNLGAPYLYIAIGKGLVPRSIIDDIKNYWMGR